MAIKVGCFALVNPFCTLPKQLEQIQSWGFRYADITDSTYSFLRFWEQRQRCRL